MSRFNWIVILLLVIGLGISSPAWGQSAGVKLKEGIYQETTGNLEGAMTIYQKIIDDDEATTFYAATAMYRLGMCQLKAGNKEKAAATFEQIIAKYPSESVVVERAKEELAKINYNSEIPEDAIIASPENLQELIDAAQPGDTIILTPGLYTEPVIITKPLTMRGQSRTDCVFEVTTKIDQPAIFINTIGPGKAKLENLTIKWGRAMIVPEAEASDFISGLTRIIGGMGMAGLVNDPNSTVDVEGLFNDPNSTMDMVQVPAMPASASNSEYYDYRGAVGIKDAMVEIEGCFFKAVGVGAQVPLGLSIRGFSDLIITRCRLEGFSFNTCFWEGTRGKVQDCLIIDSNQRGIMIRPGAEVEVIGNVICDSAGHGVKCTEGTLRAKDNLIINNGSRGFYLGDEMAAGSIINNIIMGNPYGISSFMHSIVRVENNVIMGSDLTGIDLTSYASELFIKFNIFQGNRAAVSLNNSPNGLTNSTILYNTLWNNTTDFENIVQDMESFRVDPGFVDPDNGYFAVSNSDLIANEQGLTDPEVFTVLWMRWLNRADVNEPFGIR